jgi:hypothetical protein
MKGTEIDNRRRLAQLSPRGVRERELAKLIREDKLTLTPNGELRPKREQQASGLATPTVYQLPDETWE